MSKYKAVKAQNDPEPIPIEILAKEIEAIAEAAKSLMNSRLTNRAIVLLLQDAIGGSPKVSMKVIEAVLENASKLDELYLDGLQKAVKQAKERQ